MKIQNIFVGATMAAATALSAQAQVVRVDGVRVPLPVYRAGGNNGAAPVVAAAPTPAAPPALRTNSNSNATSSSTAQGGMAYGTQGQSLSVDNHASSPVSSAVAPTLVSSNDTCMGSAAFGGSAFTFGLSFGTSYTDDNCLMLKNARELWNMGFRGAAMARMCMDERNRQALEATGVSCPAAARTARN
jgi:hypothetical protein